MDQVIWSHLDQVLNVFSVDVFFVPLFDLFDEFEVGIDFEFVLLEDFGEDRPAFARNA